MIRMIMFEDPRLGDRYMASVRPLLNYSLICPETCSVTKKKKKLV